MSQLSISNFEDYFKAIHKQRPYPWQQRLAEQAFRGDWPGAIDLPTGSGKTACIDIAIFVLACQAHLPIERRTAPRRVFFCVNRRVIVDEACSRAKYIAKALWKAEQDDPQGDSILNKVAAALRTVAGTSIGSDTPPLDVVELRGGIYKDNRWARTVTQPTVICTTLDQLGSRLLFRGYGVSSNSAPIQAALIAYDSLILLDEAHISEPFRQTLDQVANYLHPEKWAKQSVDIRPVTVVPMTATPNEDMTKRGIINLNDDDRDPSLPLLKRLIASKPAELRKKPDVSKEAIDIIKKLDGDESLAVGIMVNRIATAKQIYEELRALQAEDNDKKRQVPADAVIELVIGSMRPIDRDEQAKRLCPLVGPKRPDPYSMQNSIVIATQCLEVGADYDFDVLITECASLDALRQRFGRLNRAGRDIQSRAYILANKKDIKPEDKLDDSKPLDPIYGNALARTWNWLEEYADEVTVNGKTVRHIDFGIDAFGARLKKYGDNGRPPENLLAPSASLKAPVMLPAYIDMWCQTAPQPAPDPDVSLFIHGQQCTEPDVQVCWRADLIEDDYMKQEHWCDVVALLPPTTAECMSLPISRVRRWLFDQTDQMQDHGDVLGVSEPDEDVGNKNGGRTLSLLCSGVLWRGHNNARKGSDRAARLISSPRDLRPGDTLVLPASFRTADVLGHLPEASRQPPQGSNDTTLEVAINDVAESAFRIARNRVALRLHLSLKSILPEGEAFTTLLARATESEEPPAKNEWADMLETAADALPDSEKKRSNYLRHLAKNFTCEPYPDGHGVVLIGRDRFRQNANWFIPSLDDGDDESSQTQRQQPILLEDHTTHVRGMVENTLACLPLTKLREVYDRAAQLHDIGKADERFQAMLRRSGRSDAYMTWSDQPVLWAKSPAKSSTFHEYKRDCERAGLPLGFRHEMLSLQLAERCGELSNDPAERELVLHLIASHHGHARPFAPVVVDEELPDVEINIDGTPFCLSHKERTQLIAAHRLDSGIAERFWELTRRFGWWGLAYLEAVLRLADQQASAAEDAGVYAGDSTNRPVEETI